MIYYIDSATGPNQSEPVFGQFLPVQAQFFWDLEVPRTGPVLGSSPERSRTETGPDLKALELLADTHLTLFSFLFF